MHCRTCNYPLWNLRARKCPECAAPFAPGEYEFTPLSVRFCCPHCDHPYFGTGDRGHPDPPAFPCLRCGAAVTLDEMVLKPVSGVDDRLTSPDTMPWLDRCRRGRVRAWFEMIGRGLTAPGQVIAATPPGSPLRSAWAFGLLTTAVFIAAGGAQGAVYAWLWEDWLPGWYWPGPLMPRARVAAFLAAAVAAAALLVPLWTLVAHAILKLSGGWTLRYGRTCQAILYSAGANVFSAVPCFGPLMGLPWWAASAGIMLKRGQQVSGLRAALAAGALPGLIVLLPVAGYLALTAFSTMWSVNMAGPWDLNPGAPSYATSVVTYGVASYGMKRNGSSPLHGIEITLDADLAAFSSNLAGPLFCDPSTQTKAEDVPLGDGTLADFLQAGRARQLEIAVSVLQDQDPAVVAHRVGDFVFTSHGALTYAWDAELWLVVMLPDPDANGPPGPNDRVFIGTAQFNVIETWFSDLPALLKAQNAHRAGLGLPALPDLATVTHARPAVAPP
jgi:hypothetical protein